MSPLARRDALGLAAAWLLAAPLGAAAEAGPARRGERVVWPSVRLLDGRLLRERDLAGRACVVVFFSTTCPYCLRHNAHVQRLHEATRGLPLTVLGVALDDEASTVRRYLDERGHGFATTLDHRPMRQALGERRVIPLTCVVDAAGVLREVIPGEMFAADVMELARWAPAPPAPAS